MKKILVSVFLSFVLVVPFAFADIGPIGGGSGGKSMDNSFSLVLVSKSGIASEQVMKTDSNETMVFADVGGSAVCAGCHVGKDQSANAFNSVLPGAKVSYSRQPIFTKWEAG